MQDEDVKCVKVPILKPRLTNEVPELEKKERGLGVVFFISCCSKEADTNLNNYDLRQSERDRINKQTSHTKPIPNHSNHTHIVITTIITVNATRVSQAVLSMVKKE